MRNETHTWTWIDRTTGEIMRRTILRNDDDSAYVVLTSRPIRGSGRFSIIAETYYIDMCDAVGDCVTPDNAVYTDADGNESWFDEKTGPGCPAGTWTLDGGFEPY